MISAIVLTKNEEQNIERCLQSLTWCDELIVLDDNSTDNTILLAEKNGAKIISKKLKNFAEQRNYGLKLAKNDWILFIDADEVVLGPLKQEILSSIETPSGNVGFSVSRKDTLWGKELQYGDARNVKILRLAKKNAGEWKGSVHEAWEVAGDTSSLSNALMHYPHQTVSEFLSEINLYSTLRAEELKADGKKSNLFSIIVYTKGKFIDNYILKLGVLDGVPGLVRALMMSYYSFLVRAKLWVLLQKKS